MIDNRLVIAEDLVIILPVCLSMTLAICCTLLSVFDLTGRVVGWCKGVVYLKSLRRPTDIGLQLGKACYPPSK